MVATMLIFFTIVTVTTDLILIVKIGLTYLWFFMICFLINQIGNLIKKILYTKIETIASAKSTNM
jgi:hypothetical protein